MRRIGSLICGLAMIATAAASAESRRIVSQDELDAIRWEKAKQAAAERQLKMEPHRAAPAAVRAAGSNGVTVSPRLVADPQALREAIRWEREKTMRAERQIRVEAERAANAKPRPAESTETAPDEPR